MATNGETILKAKGVRKIYRTGAVEVEALAGVDLTVKRGEMIAVMGPSGSGKTTLLNCLSGLDDIDEGSVSIDGDEIHSLSDAKRTTQRAKRMGFVFQAFNLIPVFTAAENVELPLLLTGVNAKESRLKAMEMLDKVGLAKRASHRPSELSGGEQQRVTIARALVTNPALVWADEPTGNLDTTTAGQVMRLLRQFHSEGETIILVTHDPAIGETAGRLVRMKDGEIVSDELQGKTAAAAAENAAATVASDA